MRVSGPLIGVFLVYHLMHFTLGTVHPQFSETDVFQNVQRAFTGVGTTVFYLLVTGVVGFHLIHGTRSMLSSVGVEHPDHVRTARRALGAVALVIAVGLAAVPVGAWMGWFPEQ